MPKKPLSLRLDINLLRPQGLSDQFVVKLIRWLLTTGRFIVVIVEAVVLVAFVVRFKYDFDLETLSDNINQQIPVVQSYKNDEVIIRQTQKQLSLIKQLRTSSPDYPSIIKELSSQTPQGVKLNSLNLEKTDSSVLIRLTGEVINSGDLSAFLQGLKGDKNFSDINLESISLSKDIINFSIKGSVSSNITIQK